MILNEGMHKDFEETLTYEYLLYYITTNMFYKKKEYRELCMDMENNQEQMVQSLQKWLWMVGLDLYNENGILLIWWL